MSPLPSVTQSTPASQVGSPQSNSLESLYPREFIAAVGGDLEAVREFGERFDKYTLMNFSQLQEKAEVQKLFNEMTTSKTSRIARGLDQNNRPYLLVAFHTKEYVLFRTNTNAPPSEFNQIRHWQQDHGSANSNSGSPVTWSPDSQEQCIAIVHDALLDLDCASRLSYLSSAPSYARDDLPVQI